MAKNPQLPTRTIARMMVAENVGVWSGLDAAYMAVRYARGAMGKSHRRRPGVVASPSPQSLAQSAAENPFYLPLTDEREFLPFQIQTDRECEVAVFSDIHFPYHNLKALTAAMTEAKRRNARKIILNGDTIDFHGLSRFCKDPRRRSVKGEIETTKQFLDALRDQFPDAQIVWKDGNHEERFENYMRTHAAALIGVSEFRLEVILGLFDLRIEYVSDKRPIHLGKLPILHGHEYATPIMAPVNPARGLFLRAKTSAMQGHQHQTSEHTEPNLKGELITCWSTGCLCELHPEYMPLNKWGHGAAYVRLAPGGDYEVSNKRILRGRML